MPLFSAALFTPPRVPRSVNLPCCHSVAWQATTGCPVTIGGLQNKDVWLKIDGRAGASRSLQPPTCPEALILFAAPCGPPRVPTSVIAPRIQTKPRREVSPAGTDTPTTSPRALRSIGALNDPPSVPRSVTRYLMSAASARASVADTEKRAATATTKARTSWTLPKWRLMGEVIAHSFGEWNQT